MCDVWCCLCRSGLPLSRVDHVQVAEQLLAALEKGSTTVRKVGQGRGTE